jgi:probable HAF family extracellular repeat protein
LGQTAWFYNGSSTIPIGFTGTGYIRANGWKYSASDFMTESGKVAGYSERYTNMGDFGRTAWLYDGANTIEVGLVDAEHTALGDYKFSSARGMNEAGQLTGYSNRYNGGEIDLGQSAWIYNGTTTTKIGLTDAEHTSANGVKRSTGYAINDAGHVLGRSVRYNGGAIPRGDSAWLYNGTSTVPLGLTDAEHTGLNAYQYSSAEMFNESGQVIGYSDRYNGAETRLGQSAWFYNGTSSVNIGLTGPNHTRPDGYKYSKALELNDAGWVIGYSERFAESSAVGQDAWVYHPSLNQTIPLQLATAPDGYAYSSAEFLGADGLVLGYYQPLEGPSHAFYYTPAEGIHDLGTLVAGGLAANDWEYLATAFQANGLSQILGAGLPTTQSSGQKPFLLKAANQLAGDFNNDGAVDAADYIVWRKTDGTQPAYNAWRANFGRSNAIGSLAGTRVPEPSAAMLVLLAVALNSLYLRVEDPQWRKRAG